MAPASDAEATEKSSPFLRRFPNTSFGIVLGLGSHCLLWKTMHKAKFIQAPVAFQWFFWIVAIVVWVSFSTLYVTKIILHLDIVKKEWRHSVRANFFQMPNLAVIVLAVACPDDVADLTLLRVICVVAFVYQLCLVLIFYNRWMFSDAALGIEATTPYLLSVVGWFLLTNLAHMAKMHDLLGVDLAAFSFGTGTLFLVIVYVDIFNNLHSGVISRGHPAMFLLLAPPSVGSISLQMLLGSWTTASKSVFGAMIFLLMLLLRSGQVIVQDPAFLGIYWAYVFPLAALAICGIANAMAEDTFGARLLAWVLIVVAQIGLLVVFCRMSFHCILTASGKASWNDPLHHSAPAESKAPEEILDTKLPEETADFEPQEERAAAI